LENLSWKTPTEQRQNRDPNARSNAAQRSKGVKCLKNDKEYVSCVDAAKPHGISFKSVSNACNHGATPKGIGFKWIEPETFEGEEWRESNWKTEISSHGRFKDTNGIIKTPIPRRDGRCSVQISGKNHLVHRLVAEAFHPVGRPDQTEVNHIDHDPSNNHFENLEWASRKENMVHARRNLNRKSNAEAKGLKVRVQKIGETTWTEYISVIEAARHFDVVPLTIQSRIDQNENNEETTDES
jgi:hypothetical protein